MVKGSSGLEVAAGDCQPFGLRGVKLGEGFEYEVGDVNRGSQRNHENDGYIPVQSTEFSVFVRRVEVQFDCGEAGEIPEVTPDREVYYHQARADRDQQVVG